MPNAGDRKVDRHVMSCRLAPVFEGTTDGAPVLPPNLITRGMFINTSQFLPTGLVLKLRLPLSGREFLLRAEVRHGVPVQGVGVKFVNPSPDALQAMEVSSATC